MLSKGKRFKRFFCALVMVTGIMFVCNGISTFATDDREHIREKLNEQESELTDEMKPINPFDSEVTDNLYKNAVDSAKEQVQNSTGELNIKGKADAIQKAIFQVIIKSRTAAIISYVGVWIVGLLYAGVMGSRDVNKKRKVYLWIRNSTVLFFTYINIPLLIIWLNADKSNALQITLFNVLYNSMLVLRSNSLVIWALLVYAGGSRKIISKNDLPMRMQSKHLIKWAFILLVFLNIAPIAMYFII